VPPARCLLAASPTMLRWYHTTHPGTKATQVPPITFASPIASFRARRSAMQRRAVPNPPGGDNAWPSGQSVGSKVAAVRSRRTARYSRPASAQCLSAGLMLLLAF
jgi:hypothetical protein